MRESLSGRIMAFAERAPLIGKAILKVERRLWDRQIKRLRVEAGLRAQEATQGVVAKGLFKGMRVDPGTSWGFDQYTVLSGQYEHELQCQLEAAVKTGYACFIDIGCANGFYAVGLALLANSADVIAYDIDPNARAATKINASLNGVSDRVHVRAEATDAALTEVIRQYHEAFIICDIEGAELQVLDPARCPALREADLLVEVHGDVEAVITTLTTRFRGSHEATVIARSPRNPFDDRYVAVRSEDEAWVLVSEGRTFTRDNWLMLHRKSSGRARQSASVIGVNGH